TRWRVYPGVWTLAMFWPTTSRARRCAVTPRKAVCSPAKLLIGSQLSVDEPGDGLVGGRGRAARVVGAGRDLGGCERPLGGAQPPAPRRRCGVRAPVR